MTYVFDTSPLSTLFRNYYPDQFPSLWRLFDQLVAAGGVTSTREVFREIEDASSEPLRDWADRNRGLFVTPNPAEGALVGEIFAVRHFQQNIEQQKLLNGGKNADPFVIARARSERKIVVTMELLKPNAAKIPNICQHFGVNCLTLQGFMQREGWRF